MSECCKKAVDECLIPLDFFTKRNPWPTVRELLDRNKKGESAESILESLHKHKLVKPPKAFAIGIWDFLTVMEEYVDKEIFRKVHEKCDELVDEDKMVVEDEVYRLC